MDYVENGARRLQSGVPTWIVSLFALGLLLRVALMALYSPAALQNLDTISYIAFPPFADTRQPSGIHLFVEPFEALGSLTLLVLSQHLLGLLAAGFVTLAVRRLDGGWLAAGAAASVALFGSNQLYLEHALLTEPLFTALVSGALLAALYVDRSPGWLPAISTGLLAGASLCTRSIGMAVVALAVLGILVLTNGPIGRKALRAVATAAAAGAVVAVYMLGVTLTDEGQPGFGQWSGWYTYARAAPFADCRKFDPPEGTEVLCETSAPSTRGGPSWYMFNSESPARRHFDGPPNQGDLMRRFGRAASIAQPADYAHAVARDLLRYVDDDLAIVQSGWGGGYHTIALDRREEQDEASVVEELRKSGFGVVDTPTVRAAAVVELYAATFELDGQLLVLLLTLSVAGVVLARGRVRAGATMYLVVSAALLVVPVLTIIYNARYAIPAHILLTVPAAVGAQAIADRLWSEERSS